jgi:hypothetical protein
MNKRRTKTMRNLSKMLNRNGDSYDIIGYTERVTGSEMIREGSKFEEGIVVDLNAVYLRKRKIIVKIDHYKKLKKAYSKDGIKGIQDYIIWLNQHNINMNKKFKEMQLEQRSAEVDKKLLSIAKGKATAFWSSLIQFLFSFFAVFGSEKE